MNNEKTNASNKRSKSLEFLNQRFILRAFPNLDGSHIL